MMNNSNVESNVACRPVTSYLEEINDWTTKQVVQSVFSAFYALIFLLAFLGNTSVLIIIGSRPKLRCNPRYMYVGSLALSDLLVCFTSLPASAYTYMYKDWTFGAELCRIIPAVQALSLIISSLMLVAIAMDEYLQVFYAQRRMRDPMKIKWLLVGIWVLATMVDLPYAFCYSLVAGDSYNMTPPVCGVFCDEKNWPSLTAKQAYGTLSLLFHFAIPLLVIAVCYSRILYTIDKRLNTQRNRLQNAITYTRVMYGQRRYAYLLRHQKYNYIHILMVLLFGISWAPHFTYNTLRDYDALPQFIKSQPYFYHMITHSIAMSSLVWNPLLYTVLWSQKFRSICKDIANTLPQWWKEINASSSTDATPEELMNDNHQHFPAGAKPPPNKGFLRDPNEDLIPVKVAVRSSIENLLNSCPNNHHLNSHSAYIGMNKYRIKMLTEV